MTRDEPIAVVGGIYRELCMHPRWDEYFGSAGRAAAAISTLDIPVCLHALVDEEARESMTAHAISEYLKLELQPVKETPCFHYIHGLAAPLIQNNVMGSTLSVTSDSILRFGMIEGHAHVEGQRVVYDPQDAHNPQSFSANGSTAEELALILNRREARLLLGDDCINEPEHVASALAAKEGASIVVIKQGPCGVLVFDNGTMTHVPAYRTDSVWKIGSGDQFAANFAAAWLSQNRSAHDAADIASRATAYYCQHKGSFPNRRALDDFNPASIQIGSCWKSRKYPCVYLAGPFFNLSQLWLVEQARTALLSMGVSVFSPFHDVGPGSAQDVVEKDLEGIKAAHVVLALADGMDSGTVYEIGYARALNIPVVVYSESETIENLKMMEGSGCVLVKDFVSAIYHAVWEAVRV